MCSTEFISVFALFNFETNVIKKMCGWGAKLKCSVPGEIFSSYTAVRRFFSKRKPRDILLFLLFTDFIIYNYRLEDKSGNPRVPKILISI